MVRTLSYSIAVSKTTYCTHDHCHSFCTVQEMARVMQGVEIMIAMLPSSHSFYNFMSIDFYTCIAEDNLLDQCSTIIARIVDNSPGTTRRGRRSRTSFDMNSTLKMYRLDSEKVKDKLRKY